MSKLYKLILLLFLIGLSIIISTAIVALQIIHSRREGQLKQFLLDKAKKARFSGKSTFNSKKNQNEKASSPSSSDDASSSSSSSTKSNPTQTNQYQHTVKDTNLLLPDEIKLQQQRMAPDTNSHILLGESHLGLALRDIPYETHDTNAFYPPVELSGNDDLSSSSAGASNSGKIADVVIASASTGASTTSSTSASGGNIGTSSLSSRFGGNAIPPQLRYGAIVPHEELDHVDKQLNTDHNEKTPIVNGGLKRRGVEFVKVENPVHSYEGSGKIRQSSSSSSSTSSSSMENQQEQRGRMIQPSTTWIMNFFSSKSNEKSRSSKRRKRSSSSTSTFSSSSTTNTTLRHKYAKEHSVLFHLQKASEYGNHYAQNMIANSLASGILPVSNDPLLREHLNITLSVTSDFSGSTSTSSKSSSKSRSSPSSDNAASNQLSKAILLWHMSAMEGNIESLMTLGYRHYISATSRSNSIQSILVHDDDLKLIEESDEKKVKKQILSSARTQYENTNDRNNAAGRKKKQTPVRHSPQESHHYGVLGTCESSLAYYEEAVNQIMDELESGPLRGKVTPAVDAHILPEIRQRGSSSALTPMNKPDELDEAIKFLEMKALHREEGDTSAAYKLGGMYQYGTRGVKQDLRMALKYYEIGAENNSWESAGQAGKFYLFGMGLEDEERDLEKAHRYFKTGMPGGISTCEDRFMKKQQNTHQDRNDDDDFDGDDDEYEEEYGNLWEKTIYQCDTHSVNGMGLLYIFGVPDKLEPNLKTAVRHFELAKNMGDADAMYNLGMLRLGWNNPFYDDLFNQPHSIPGMPRGYGRSSNPKRGPSTSGFLEATALFTSSAELGHLQAKHRLGMIYSKGFKIENSITVRPECKKALSIFKGIATTVGTTVTKRMRAAYKQYMAGDYESSLRNYLAAAETGKIEAQVNAAFLLQEGYCLGMDHLQCMKASVRLWRAAAKMGHEEAYLRVGDFYYYGRLREDMDRRSVVAQRDLEFGLSPLPLARYILYPEDLIPKVRKGAVNAIRWFLEQRNVKVAQTCSAKDSEEETCFSRDLQTKGKLNNGYFSAEQLDHFKIAAKYYRTAAVELQSARANFNLGFMHEWGLGLPKDFYLAKRYYDLAAAQAQSTGDGVVANQIALFCMNMHEYFLKQKSAFDEWMNESEEDKSDEATVENTVQSPTDSITTPKTKLGVILYHILTWESALILIFTWALKRLVQHRYNRTWLQQR